MRLFAVICLIFFCFQGQLSASGGRYDDILKVRTIVIEGNKVTKEEIIRREIVFKEGDFLSKAKLHESIYLTRSNIINTNLFLEVDVDYSISDDDALDFKISIKERWYWSILPHWTLADRSFNEWWYERGRDLSRTTYGLDVRHSNVTGNGDQFTTSIHLGFVPLYKISYFKPYIDKKRRIGVSGGLYYSQQRNLPFRTWNDKLDFIESEKVNRSRFGAALDFRYRKRHNYFHFLQFGFSRSSVSDTVVTVNPEYFGNGIKKQGLFSVRYEYRIDYRDVRQYPLKGMFFSGSVSQYFTTLGTSQANVNLRYNQYLPLNKRLFLDLGIRGKASFPREQSYALVSGLGFGGNVPRGYELYVIDGQYFVLSSNTFKIKAFERKFNIEKIIRKKEFSSLPITIYPNVFIDYGYVRNFYPERSNSALSNKHLLGRGVGLDIVTFYNINFRTQYSVNQMNERKLFFALSRDF